MKTIKITIVAIIISLFPISAIAQQGWDLRECIEYAKENNLQVKQSELLVEQSKNMVTQQKYQFLPSISGNLSHSMSWGRSVNLQTLEIIKNKLSMSTSGSLNASVTLFDGLSNVYNLKSSQVQLRMSEEQVEKLKNDITIQITQAYLQVLLAKAIYESAQESCKSVEEQVDRTTKLVEAGSQAYSTQLEVQAQLATEKSQLVVAENNVRTALLTLVQLLDLPQEKAEDFEIKTPTHHDDIAYEMLPPKEFYSIYTKALNLPQIRIQELAVKKSEYDYKSAFGRYFPSLSVHAGYGSYYADGQHEAFFTQFKHNKNPSIGFTLSFPIFNSLTTRMNVRNQKIALDNERINLELQKQNLYKEIQTAYNGAYSAYQSMNAAKENLNAIQESFTYTENKFNVGMVNATDYNLAKTNLFKAASTYYQSLYQYIFELKILDFYTGKQIEL